MLAYTPVAVDDATEALDALAIGGELYAHPSRALGEAQALAAGTGIASLDGTVLAALVVVFRDDEQWGTCCPTCLRAVGDVHAPRVCSRTGAVMPHEAVVRPLEQLTRDASRAAA